MTYEQAAEELGKSVSTLYFHVEKGNIARDGKGIDIESAREYFGEKQVKAASKDKVVEITRQAKANISVYKSKQEEIKAKVMSKEVVYSDEVLALVLNWVISARGHAESLPRRIADIQTSKSLEIISKYNKNVDISEARDEIVSAYIQILEYEMERFLKILSECVGSVEDHISVEK